MVREMKLHESRVKELRETKASGNFAELRRERRIYYCGTAMLSCLKCLTAN